MSHTDTHQCGILWSQFLEWFRCCVGRVIIVIDPQLNLGQNSKVHRFYRRLVSAKMIPKTPATSMIRSRIHHVTFVSLMMLSLVAAATPSFDSTHDRNGHNANTMFMQEALLYMGTTIETWIRAFGLGFGGHVLLYLIKNPGASYEDVRTRIQVSLICGVAMGCFVFGSSLVVPSSLRNQWFDPQHYWQNQSRVSTMEIKGDEIGHRWPSIIDRRGSTDKTEYWCFDVGIILLGDKIVHGLFFTKNSTALIKRKEAIFI